MEELEATLRDSSRMNDVFTETNWKAVENFVIYFEKIISASIDPLTQLNKTNHPRSYFALIYKENWKFLCITSGDIFHLQNDEKV